mmetsp:Transcript_15211/g.31966  ORF Transcript_15211/g.31966 Transcript_15211/m.31966 type:complete len:585 (+) Transcript_15211:92-1846(+)
MTSSGSALFKRVISNPDEMMKAERDGKISKVVKAFVDAKDNADESTLMKQLALADFAGTDLKECSGNDESPPKDGCVADIEATRMAEDADPDAPITSVISHVNSRTSATNSSLSAGSNEGNGDSAPLQDGKGRNITRRVSHGSNSSSDGARQPSVSGDYGWFDEMHGYESAGMSESAKKLRGLYSDDASGNERGGGSKTKKKQGGMLQIESDLMQQALFSIVEPQRETNAMAVTAPTYVLEESLSSQKLWKQTAGNRPPQPVEERAFFEQMWAQNFTRSKVKYEIPVEVLTASTPISISPFNDDGFGDDGAGPGGSLSNYNLAAPFNVKSGDEHAATDPASVKAAQADVAEATLIHKLNSNGAVEMYFDPNRPKDYNLKTLGPHHHHHTLVNKKVKGAGSENDLTVLVRGDNVFGTTVSKSFPRTDDKGQPLDGIDTVSISIASYRVVESKKHGKYAQYLVIFCDGNFRNTVGVWKRYSDFSELSRKVTHGHSESCAAVVTGLNPLSVTDDNDVEMLPNAITSWRLLKKRQRWYRCLDAGYLSLKVFLLERFLHDILFESSNPQILRDFVGVNSSEASKLNTKG